MKKKTTSLVLIAGIASAVAEAWRELHGFRVTHYGIRSEKLQEADGPKTVLFLSDLHNQVYGEGNQRLVDAVRSCRPDLILVGGDMLVAKNGHPYREALSFLRRIAGICPVYYANGNHEQRMKERPEDYEESYQEYKWELERAGVCFLENASARVKLGGCKITVTGLEIPRRCYTHFRHARLRQWEVEARIGKAGKEDYQILLAHNPAYMERYLQWGADLVLCGHLHGGVVRLPGLGGVISPGFRLFPRYSGEHSRKGGADIVVSKGLGVHTVYMRLFNPAEVVALHLHS